MILSALCKNFVDAVSKPSFYFLLRPAFVIGVVILVLAPTGFHVRGLALAGNLVACSMRFQRLTVKPMMRPKVRQHQQTIGAQIQPRCSRHGNLLVLPIVRPTRSRLDRIFENILRGPVVEFPSQHSALRYASDGMLGQCEDLRIYSYEWYRNLSRFAGEYEPDALSAGIFATGHRCATFPNSESIQAGFKQAPPEAVSSYQKRKASNLIQRFINLLTMAGVDLHCPLPDMAYDLRGNIIQTQTHCGRTGS